MKIADYVPPVKESMRLQFVYIDTYYRPIHLPQVYYDYFNSTFIIPYYTCNESEDYQYGPQDPTYFCYCNGLDYHDLPNISINYVETKGYFEMTPRNYLYLPAINYDTF